MRLWTPGFWPLIWTPWALPHPLRLCPVKRGVVGSPHTCTQFRLVVLGEAWALGHARKGEDAGGAAQLFCRVSSRPDLESLPLGLGAESLGLYSFKCVSKWMGHVDLESQCRLRPEWKQRRSFYDGGKGLGIKEL